MNAKKPTPLERVVLDAKAMGAARDRFRASLRAAHDAGSSYRQIADALGIPHATLHRWTR